MEFWEQCAPVLATIILKLETFNQGVPGSNPGGLTKFANKYK
jgi:hypothetical protein